MENLPLEVLASTFEFLLASCTIRGYSVTRTYLVLVCKQWQEIINNTPALWSVISNSYPLQVVERSFVFSRDLPLVIDLTMSSASHGQTKQDSQLFLKYWDRIFALRIIGLFSEFSDLLEQPSQILQYLSVDPGAMTYRCASLLY